MGFVVSSSCLKDCCIGSTVPLGPGILSFLVSWYMYYGYCLGQVDCCQESANLRQIFNLSLPSAIRSPRSLHMGP